MEHEGRCVGNRVNAYTSDMDFHGGSKLSKLTYPIMASACANKSLKSMKAISTYRKAKKEKQFLS